MDERSRQLFAPTRRRIGWRALNAAIVCAWVCAMTICAGMSRAAIPLVTNPALQSAASNAFRSIKDDVDAMISCHGCSDSLDPLVQDVGAGEHSLNALPDYTGATYDAYSNAFKALQYYGRFALAYSDYYIDVEYGITAQETDDLNLAKTYLTQARGFAVRADEALSIDIVP